MQEWTIEQASEEDAPAVLALQKLAYQSEAELYDDYTIAPLLQTPEEMLADFDREAIFKVMMDGRIVGSARAHMDGDSCYIGRLIVHPDMQNRGIGTALLQRVEEHFPAAGHFELFTGHRSERNLHLYAKLGYQVVELRPVSEKLTLVLLEKPGEGRL